MNLSEYQHSFMKSIHSTEVDTKHLSHGYLPPHEVISVYTNHYYLSLIEALSATYSCVERLVGEEFFQYICSEYIKQHPPKTGNIIDYGEQFANFIHTLESCKELPYLSEMANFEYCYEQVYHNLDNSYMLYSSYALLDMWQLGEQSGEMNIYKDTYIKIFHDYSEVTVLELEKDIYLQEIQHE